VQTWGAGDFGEVAVNTIVEQVADGRIRVGEVAVLTGTVLVALRGLWKGTKWQQGVVFCISVRLQISHDLLSQNFLN
jgi:hypothetical protein